MNRLPVGSGGTSSASLLWLQVGISHPYEIMLGAAEVLGGLLLFLPRTATLGALVSLLRMGQVFMLNMSFDVPVKIRRVANVLVLERPSDPASQPPLFVTPRANRIAAVVQAGRSPSCTGSGRSPSTPSTASPCHG